MSLKQKSEMNVNEKGFELYWENYHRAFEWFNNSNISHWKARAQALEVENALLRDFIRKEIPSSNLPPDFSPSSKNILKNRHGGGNELSVNVEDAVEECELLCSEKDVDEELLAFYEKTIRHKLERKKQQSLKKRDSEDSSSDNEKIYSMGPISSIQKSSEMAVLYGNAAPKILSMELSMQINFDMNCNKSNAQLWPNIPLRLS